MSRHRTGLIAGVVSYVIWGLFPLFWPLVEPAGPLEILASRVIFSLATAVTLALFLVPRHRWRPFLSRRNLVLLSLAAGW